MLFDFASPPNPGTTLHIDEQSYELIGSRPYVRKDGGQSILLDWETACPGCGTAFRISTSLKPVAIKRRCAACKQQGRPVKGKRGRKIKSWIEMS